MSTIFNQHGLSTNKHLLHTHPHSTLPRRTSPPFLSLLIHFASLMHLTILESLLKMWKRARAKQFSNPRVLGVHSCSSSRTARNTASITKHFIPSLKQQRTCFESGIIFPKLPEYLRHWTKRSGRSWSTIAVLLMRSASVQQWTSLPFTLISKIAPGSRKGQGAKKKRGVRAMEGGRKFMPAKKF